MTDEKTLFEYAKELKEYCSNHQGCVNCVFNVLSSDDCVLEKGYPSDWRLGKIPDSSAVKLLKEMRYNALNATQYDDEKREAKAEALKMAIEALGGRDDE